MLIDAGKSLSLISGLDQKVRSRATHKVDLCLHKGHLCNLKSKQGFRFEKES